MKGSEELRIDFGLKAQRLGGKWTLPSQKATGSPPPSLERQKVLSQEDQGPPETCIFIVRDLGLQSPKRSVGTKDRPLDRSTSPFLSEEWFFLENA